MPSRTANSYIKLVIGILFVLIIFTYTYMKSGNYLEGPVIIINAPENGMTVSDSLINIEGTANYISHIQLNNNQIYVDENGKINEQLLLSYGYNIITLEAEDRFGRKIKKTIEIVYK